MSTPLFPREMTVEAAQAICHIAELRKAAEENDEEAVVLRTADVVKAVKAVDPDWIEEMLHRIREVLLDADDSSVEMAHRATSQVRDEYGRFRESRWRKANPHPSFGAQFFR